MAKPKGSIKHVQIDKSQSMILIATAVAAFTLIFMIVAAKSLVGQIVYQNKIISGKKDAVKQLKNNVQATSSLETSYKAFVTTSQNVLGGNPQGTGQQDGDNAKIVLDALPSKYDFPALATSLDRLATSQHVDIQNIAGSDDEIAQAGNESSPNPQPVEIPFELTVTGGYTDIQNLVNSFGASIRPFQIQTMQIAGGQSNMTLTLTAKTYYQPAKNFEMTKKVIK